MKIEIPTQHQHSLFDVADEHGPLDALLLALLALHVEQRLLEVRVRDLARLLLAVLLLEGAGFLLRGEGWGSTTCMEAGRINCGNKSKG